MEMEGLRAVYAALVLLLVHWVKASELTVKVQADGQYTVCVNGTVWLYSSDTWFRDSGQHHSTADGSLHQLAPPHTGSGSDSLGAWRSTTLSWSTGHGHQVDTVVRQYTDISAVVFSQNFVSGFQKTRLGNKNGVISGFPSFLTGKSDTELGFMTYGGLFIGWVNMNQTNIGRWSTAMRPTDGLDSGPLLVFDRRNNVVIISPFSQFMAASFAHDTQTNTLSWGLMGDVDTVHEGFQYSTILFYSDKGINKAMAEWGAVMRKWYQRSSAARDLDPSISYIGYYTDNGAFYYHHTEPGTNYEQTLTEVIEYTRKIKIPYRYIQLDDWWYPVKGPGYGATITWTADPKVFPHGLEYVYNITQLPVVGHNRYWSNTTLYARQNGGQFDFLMDGKLSLPDDQRFWDYLLRSAKEWGLIVYEQDWLNYQVNHFTTLHSDLTLGRRWLSQMGEAAARVGLQIQYCMAQPRHLLASLEVPAVSQIRASIDYQLDTSQWQIGVTSIFADALGVAPFKDNFWTTSKQPGNPYNATEPYPLFEATVALLSAGPVGVSDRVGHTDTSITDRLINAEGLLLKPSKPATAIDAQIFQRAFRDVGPVGEVWTTHSLISELFFGIIFSPYLNVSYRLGPRDAGFPMGKFMVYSYKFTSVNKPQVFSVENPLTLEGCQLLDFCLYYTSPILRFKNKPLVILGELSKLVPMSAQRVTSIEQSSDDIKITLRGKPAAEYLNFYVYHSDQTILFSCFISQSGTATISVAHGTCY